MHFTPPKFIKKIIPDMIWRFPSLDGKKRIYLTFDDGPTPAITSWVLEQLALADVKATFFALAKNVEQNPELFQKVVEAGHAVGNHTYSHQKAWNMTTTEYIEDVDLADSFIKSNLFRPPYGMVFPRQAKRVSSRYKIIMWDVLSRDYSHYCTPESCLSNVLNGARDGSIVVFHDSAKAFNNLKYTLPIVLKRLKEEGYEFCKIEL